MTQVATSTTDASLSEVMRGMVAARGGIYPVAKVLGLSRSVTAAIAAGSPVRAGSLAMARESVKRLGMGGADVG